MRKDEKIIGDIQSVLRSFDEKYNEGKSENVESFVKAFFIDEKDTSFIGTGIDSWNFGLEAIANVIKSCWEDESKCLDKMALEIDKSIISVENSVAIVAVKGTNRRNIDDEKVYENIVATLSKELLDKKASRSDLIKLSVKISEELNNIRLGQEYIWPFRVTVVMVNHGSKWMIKHMYVSFCQTGEYTMVNNENIDNKFKVLPIEGEDSAEISEVQEVLRVFQEAYDKRDAGLVDSYGEELLLNDEDFSLFGTGQGEIFHGFNGGKQLFESDWKYWGDFNLNRENAYISILGSVAVVETKSLIKFSWGEEKVCSWPKGGFEWYLKEKKSNKELAELMLSEINGALSVLEVSEDKSTLPMRFIGVLVKRVDKWRFIHMHFSDAVDSMPERLEE